MSAERFPCDEQVKQIPEGAQYRANRYDTDDEHVLHIWDPYGGNSYDIRVRKGDNQ